MIIDLIESNSNLKVEERKDGTFVARRSGSSNNSKKSFGSVYEIDFKIFDNGVIRYSDNTEYHIADPSFDIIKTTSKKIKKKDFTRFLMIFVILIVFSSIFFNMYCALQHSLFDQDSKAVDSYAINLSVSIFVMMILTAYIAMYQLNAKRFVAGGDGLSYTKISLISVGAVVLVFPAIFVGLAIECFRAVRRLRKN